jgi:4-carboxymuconolactone decarboxylase
MRRTVTESRRERAERVFREVMLADPPQGQSPFRMVGQLDQGFADVWSREGLPRKDRRWVTLTCLAARMAADPLRRHLRAALASADITLDELLEGVLHFAAYGGMARAEMYDNTVCEVAGELGLTPSVPADLAAPEWSSEDERVAAAQAANHAVIGREPIMFDQADVLTRFGTVGIVFAEVWGRPGISRRERRIISLVCSAMSGAPGPTMVHWKAALQVGDLTGAELGEVALHFALYAGWPQVQVMPNQMPREHRLRIQPRLRHPAREG